MEGMLPGLFEGGGLGDMCDCLGGGGLGDMCNMCFVLSQQ